MKDHRVGPQGGTQGGGLGTGKERYQVDPSSGHLTTPPPHSIDLAVMFAVTQTLTPLFRKMAPIMAHEPVRKLVVKPW